MNNLLKIVFCLLISFTTSCTYKKFNPGPTAFDDKALLDSAKNQLAFVFYKNAPSVIYSASNGPHGPFKLKFNKLANSVLTDNGKLPIGKVFPNGSFVVKEVQSSGIYAFMYKKSGSWLWGEAYADGSIIFAVSNDPGKSCINCHSQSGQRDLVMSFNFY